MGLVLEIYVALLITAYLSLVVVTGTKSCNYNGNTYPINSIIEDTGCSFVICSREGEIVFLEQCPSDVDRKAMQQNLLLAVKRGSNEPCYYRGSTYQPAEVISSFYDEQSGYCYGRICVDGDETVLWATPNCDPNHVRSAAIHSLREIVHKLELNYLKKMFERVNNLRSQKLPPKVENSGGQKLQLKGYSPLNSRAWRANLKPKASLHED